MNLNRVLIREESVAWVDVSVPARGIMNLNEFPKNQRLHKAVSVPARGIMNLNRIHRTNKSDLDVSVPARGIMNLNMCVIATKN